MSDEKVIVARDLTRRFGDTVAVNSLSLEVYAGEIFGFLGHNGAGKTTTVRLLNGILEPDAGEMRVLGFSPQSEGPVLRRHTGVLTETPALEERLTGRQNLSIYADLFDVPLPQVSDRVAGLLDTFGLTERADEKVAAYSKGMKQRLALARALLHAPQILFLDEPTGGLDPLVTRQVHNLIRRLSKEEGRTVFLCTHNLAEAQQLCDRVGVMEHGHLIALGTPAELAHRLQPHQRLEIEVGSGQGAAAAGLLQRLNGLLVESPTGDNVLVQGATREAIPALLGHLLQAGIGVYRVSPQEPSLADVYFSLHQHRTQQQEVNYE